MRFVGVALIPRLWLGCGYKRGRYGSPTGRWDWVLLEPQEYHVSRNQGPTNTVRISLGGWQLRGDCVVDVFRVPALGSIVPGAKLGGVLERKPSVLVQINSTRAS